EHPSSLFRTSGGDFFAIDADFDTVFFIDGVTGNRTRISGNGAGSGTDFDGTANDVMPFPSGSDVLAEDDHHIFRINSVTGARTVISSDIVGTGPTFQGLE